MAPLERIVRRRQLSRELIGGIDEGVIGIDEIWAGLVLRARLQPLAAGGGHVLEHAAALKHARHLYDVVLAVDAKQSELPIAATAGGVDVAAQSGLARTSDDLLKWRIPSSKHGFKGLEQPSSSGVGIRFASEYPA